MLLRKNTEKQDRYHSKAVKVMKRSGLKKKKKKKRKGKRRVVAKISNTQRPHYYHISLRVTSHSIYNVLASYSNTGGHKKNSPKYPVPPFKSRSKLSATS